jgi:hypothetical protein
MASAPYTKKKGVSPVARLGDVRLPHSAHGSSSIHFFAMLLYAVIGAHLETLEDFFIGSLNLVIALWISNGRIGDLDAKVLIVSLERIAGKLAPVVSDDSFWDPNPAYDGLHVNWHPLSVMILFGTPNLHMMDFMNLTTGTASSHLVNLSMAM